jgi:hypothetical protein
MTHPEGADVASRTDMHSTSGNLNDATARGQVPEHPRISDALARATLQALLDSETVGVALVRASDWTHVLASATYERLIGAEETMGRSVWDAISEAVVPRAMLASVVSTGKGARPDDLLVRTEGEAGADAIHVALTVLPVRRVTPEADGVLVLAQDVSRQVHERRIGELFVALANDMAAERDETGSIRASVSHASEALAADAASIFLLSPDGKRLHGALVGWDWTRTSFVAEVEDWPNVSRAMAANEPAYVTAETARLAEMAWFERRGITAAICAPMAADGRVLGVVFFDYTRSNPAKVDLALAKGIADQCALLVQRASAHV